MADYRVDYITLSSGRSVSAEKVICPVCKVLDMETDFDTTEEPVRATCSEGHEWKFTTKADA